jgi:hypothetical protein
LRDPRSDISTSPLLWSGHEQVLAFVVGALTVWVAWPASGPLTHDEAWRANAVLLGTDHVHHVQVIDGLMLLLGKLLGGAPWALRTPNALAVLAAAAAMTMLARRLGASRTTALLLTAAFVLTPGHIVQLRQAKPFAVDMAFALLVARAALDVDDAIWRRRLFVILIGGSAAGLLSAVFLLPAMAVLLVVERRHDLETLGALVCVLAVLAFTTLVFTYDPTSAGRVAAMAIWQPHLLSEAPSLLHALANLGALSTSEGASLLPLPGMVFGPLVLGALLVAWRQGHRCLVALVLIPLTLEVALSLAGRFPFLGRPSSFLYALCHASLAAGAAWLVGEQATLARRAAGLLAALVFLGATAPAGLEARQLHPRAPLLVEEVVDLALAGESVFAGSLGYHPPLQAADTDAKRLAWQQMAFRLGGHVPGTRQACEHLVRGLRTASPTTHLYLLEEKETWSWYEAVIRAHGDDVRVTQTPRELLLAFTPRPTVERCDLGRVAMVTSDR